MALDFVRRSDSAREAVLSAIRDVRGALPEAALVEVNPDIVGLTDVAELLGCSRQNMRKLLISGGTSAPAPIHEGTPSLWHLASLLEWLVREKRYAVSPYLLELSEAAMRVNAALDSLRTDDGTREEIRAMLA